MAVSFGQNTRVFFNSPTNALGLTSKTYVIRGTGTGSFANNIITFNPTFPGIDPFTGDKIGFALSGGNLQISFVARFTTTNGVWEASSPVSGDASIIISYNGGATANNPVIYVNGTSVTVTRSAAPVGTYTVSTSNLYVGCLDSGSTSKVEDFRIYNVIKTAAQVTAIAAEDIRTDQNIDETGLVFHAPLVMCKGLTYDTYVGSTLAAANEFYDRVNGYVGVPSGSPVGA